ncbi:uncharacterized protein OCT59_002301 [Rhizophagus irregularis]|uniref:uncharacterized protein n=1 Tax=Rhizophagus irregularis TaxID=588596 RepID=UPI00331A1431|nr:hypothetical protein OCT59_002301 [Rhizophagus irregularis]
MTLSTISSLELRKKIKQMEATYNMLAIKYQELENCMKNNNNQQKDTKQNIVNLQTNVTSLEQNFQLYKQTQTQMNQKTRSHY